MDERIKKYKKLGHKMRPVGFLANSGELQCYYCGATNIAAPDLTPENYVCTKNPKYINKINNMIQNFNSQIQDKYYNEVKKIQEEFIEENK